MDDQLTLLRYVASSLDQAHIPYFVTGSYATILYGEVRMTNDIDIVVDLRTEKIDAFMRCFSPERFYVTREAVEDAVGNHFQFNVIDNQTMTKIDFMISSDEPLDQERFRRIRRIARTVDYEVAYSSPEDVILKKLEFHKMSDSEKHLRDVAGILKIGGDDLDRAYLEKWVDQLEVRESWHAARQLSGDDV